MHFCVLLWGFTAILGKLITLPATALVWWRMILVTAVLICVPKVWRSVSQLSARLIVIYAGIGCMVALHWLAFYAAIKLSNASVAATCIAMSPVFLAWVAPLLTSRRFKFHEMILGVAVVPAVALVVGGTPTNMRLGIGVGVIAAALVAVFGSLNKRYVEQADSLTVTAIEIGAGALFLTALGPLFTGDASMFTMPGEHDAVLLIILALVCTLFPFVLSLVALRKISAFGAQLAVNLEPVYAILLAILLLGEQRELTWQFYIGVTAIMAVVLVHPYLTRDKSAAPT
ncbi:MAG: DMT family transporter [Candidatus Obscuribacterales bacterium]|nr:DMT family transporter [Steroidobacteraceae bacterium]